MLTEHEEQVNLINWCDAHHDHRVRSIYAHMNGVRTTIGAAMKAKAEGARAGIPDLFLPIGSNGFFGLYLEMKRLKGGTLSDVQRKRMFALSQSGYECVRANGAEEAKLAIEEYLNIYE